MQKLLFKKGYTLIEILVAITIIGLLFSFGYSNFRDFARRQALSGVAKTLQGDIRLAQSKAIAGEKPEQVSGYADVCQPGSVLISHNFYVASSTEYQIQASCTAGVVPTKIVTMPAGISVSVPVPNPITFKVLGRGTNIESGGNAIVTLTEDATGNQVTITISSAGEIK